MRQNPFIRGEYAGRFVGLTFSSTSTSLVIASRSPADALSPLGRQLNIFFFSNSFVSSTFIPFSVFAKSQGHRPRDACKVTVESSIGDAARREIEVIP
jgi:hypothetical protein